MPSPLAAHLPATRIGRRRQKSPLRCMCSVARWASTTGGFGLPVPQEQALLTSAARMAERSQHRVSEAQDGRSERPAMGHGWPEAGLGEVEARQAEACPTFYATFDAPRHRWRLASRKTRHPAVFAWQPLAAGAGHRILRRSFTFYAPHRRWRRTATCSRVAWRGRSRPRIPERRGSGSTRGRGR